MATTFKTFKPARVTEPRAFEVVQAESGAAILDNVQAAVSFRHVAKYTKVVRNATGKQNLDAIDHLTGILPEHVKSIPEGYKVPRQLRRRNK